MQQIGETTAEQRAWDASKAPPHTAKGPLATGTKVLVGIWATVVETGPVMTCLDLHELFENGRTKERVYLWVETKKIEPPEETAKKDEQETVRV